MEYEYEEGEESEYLTEYYDDDYPPVSREDEEAVRQRFFDPDQSLEQSFHDILNYCMRPILEETGLHIAKYIFWCFIFRVVTQSIGGRSLFEKNDLKM